jgi:hypothetical protein
MVSEVAPGVENEAVINGCPYRIYPTIRRTIPEVVLSPRFAAQLDKGILKFHR